MQFELDLLGYAAPTTTASALGCALVKAATAQLDKMVEQISSSYASSPASPPSAASPAALHFKPKLFPVPVSAVFATTNDDDAEAAVQQRRHLHKAVGLPEDRPLFRPANALDLYRQRLPDRLRNPHTTLPPSGCVDGKQFLTKGDYDYYHYMQDSFDDNGWGCAYRSLQTIVSWFVLQGYKQINVPGHVAIQELCVSKQTKAKTFIGSKEWIGSFEVRALAPGAACSVGS